MLGLAFPSSIRGYSIHCKAVACCRLLSLLASFLFLFVFYQVVFDELSAHFYSAPTVPSLGFATTTMGRQHTNSAPGILTPTYTNKDPDAVSLFRELDIQPERVIAEVGPRCCINVARNGPR